MSMLMGSEYADDAWTLPGDGVAVLARDIDVRVLNCSASGCLLETRSRLEVGTVASLRLKVDGRELTDQVVVVRCQPIEGAGARFHVGARFLELAPPTPGTVRRILGYSSEVVARF